MEQIISKKLVTFFSLNSYGYSKYCISVKSGRLCINGEISFPDEKLKEFLCPDYGLVPQRDL
jgi:hypothetical protein